MHWRHANGAQELISDDGEVLGQITLSSDESGARWRVAVWKKRFVAIGRRVALDDARDLLVRQVVPKEKTDGVSHDSENSKDVAVERRD